MTRLEHVWLDSIDLAKEGKRRSVEKPLIWTIAERSACAELLALDLSHGLRHSQGNQSGLSLLHKLPVINLLLWSQGAYV